MAAFDPADPLVAAPCVILVDACSMLDIVRLPIREQAVADVRSVNAMLSASVAGLVFMAMPEVIELEFIDHRGNQEANTRGELRKQHPDLLADPEATRRVRRRCGLTTAELPEMHGPKDWGDKLSARFGLLADTVHRSLTIIPRDAGDEARGYDRTVRRAPPAVRGAASVNDSVLCEVSLRLAKHRPRLTTGLLTSNDRDFRTAMVLHRSLANEYNNAGLIDLRSWDDAVSFTRSVTHIP